jgi:hypothetical protein
MLALWASWLVKLIPHQKNGLIEKNEVKINRQLDGNFV